MEITSLGYRLSDNSEKYELDLESIIYGDASEVDNYFDNSIAYVDYLNTILINGDFKKFLKESFPRLEIIGIYEFDSLDKKLLKLYNRVVFVHRFLVEVLDLFREFIRFIDKFYRTDQRRYLYSTFLHQQIQSNLYPLDHFKHFSSTREGRLKKLKLLLLINLDILLMEHVPKLDINEQLYQTKNYVTFLNLNKGASVFVPVLLTKAEHLLNRQVSRVLLDNREEEEPFPFYDVMEASRLKPPIPEFRRSFSSFVERKNDFIDYANIHYEIYLNWKEGLMDFYNEVGIKEVFELSYQEMMVFIKYAKDIERNDLEAARILNAIVEELKTRLKAPARKKDELYTRYFLLYALNNQLSKQIDLYLGQDTANDNLDISIKKTYDSICTYQDQFKIRNYFPHSKYFNLLVKKIGEMIENRGVLDYRESCEKLLTEASKVHRKYKSCVSWSHTNLHYLVILPPRECYLSLSSEISVYIYNCGVLPTPSRQKYLKTSEEDYGKYLGYRASLKLAVSLNDKLDVLNGLEEKVNNKDARSVEVLAVFSAIITFITGSLTQLPAIKSPHQVTFFILSLGSILILFVLVLISLLRSNFNKKFSLRNVVIAIVVTILVVIFLAWKNPYWLQSSDRSEETKSHTTSDVIRRF